MTELGEQSSETHTGDDGELSRRSEPVEPTRPLWRLRGSFAPEMVRSLRSKLVPRIFITQAQAVGAAQAIAEPGFSREVCDFAALTLSIDAYAASDFVDRLLANDVSVETVFLQWLAPAARRLGAQWETDETDFATVTLGVSRLHMIMRRLGEDFCNGPAQTDSGESVLLTVVPGEQHSFGLSMVAEFFRRAGWNLCTGPFESHRELTSLVHSHWFDIVGFSVGSDRRLDDLKRDIDAIRSGSRNRAVGIMLGGPMMEQHPEWLQSLGADMMSTDAVTAPQQARDLIGRMQARGGDARHRI